MVYQKKFVAAIRVAGQILREDGDLVTLPFGSEYSIILKNLNSVRSQVNVSVDGTLAADRLVIGPNQTLDLERFIRDGNMDTGNRFKFIERTVGVEGHRGIKEDDGLIRIEYTREKVQTYVDVPVPRYYHDPIPVPRPYYPRPFCPPCPPRPKPWFAPIPYRTASGPTSSSRPSGRPSRSMAGSRSLRTEQERGSSLPEVETKMSCDFGITVPGSQSNQRFHTVSGFPLEPTSEVIVIRLRGQVGGKVVVKPVTVKTKATCSTCGKKNGSGVKFCSDCGTALELW